MIADNLKGQELEGPMRHCDVCGNIPERRRRVFTTPTCGSTSGGGKAHPSLKARMSPMRKGLHRGGWPNNKTLS